MAAEDNDMITLLSTYGEKIEVAAFYLKAQSPVFRDMLSLSVTNTQPGEKCPAVDIALDGKDLKIFVAYLTGDLSSVPTALEWDTIRQIVAVADQFGLDNVSVRVLNAKFTIPHGDIWACFCVAANHDQYHLAKAVIARMYDIEALTDGWSKAPLSAISTDMMAQVDRLYLGRLLQAIGRRLQKAPGLMDDEDWEMAAADFQRP